MKTINHGIITLTIVLAAGCSVFERNSNAVGADGLPLYDRILVKNSDLIAQNLIYAATQLSDLRPIQTTVQIIEPTTPLGKTVLGRLIDAGYGIQKVQNDVGPKYVRYRFVDSLTETGAITSYSMEIGDIEISRDFRLVKEELVPDSALRISGAGESFIELNDAIFTNKGARYEENVIFTDLELPKVVGPKQLTAGANYNPEQFIQKNMYEAKQSNYKVLFDGYKTVEQQILIFANDSMVLGSGNKKTIGEFAKKMDTKTDLISVVGCSHGKSKITNGNSVLALGRAHRVKEAFVFAGIEYGKVLDEGCWAPEYFDEQMPRRGVVVTLKRKLS